MRFSLKNIGLGTGAVALVAIGGRTTGQAPSHGAHEPPAVVSPPRLAGAGGRGRPARRCPSISTIAARTEAIRNITLQAKVAGLYCRSRRCPTARTSSKATALSDRPARFSGGPRSGESAGAARHGRARLCALQSRRGTELLRKDGCLAKDAFDQRTSTLRQARGGTRGRCRPRSRRPSSISAIPKSARRSPAALGRNQAPVGTLVNAAGTPLNTLVQLDPIYVTFNPSETDLAAIERRTGRRRSRRR